MGEFRCYVQLDELLSDFEVSEKKLHKIKDLMIQEMNKGLKGQPSDLRMLPTFVRALPNGSEQGRYVALDLGGTRFRVLIVNFGEGTDNDEVTSKWFDIPEKVMKGTGFRLFDYMAECIAIVISENSLQDYELPLGFTFSFPCELNGLASATLLNWTKGFNIPEVIGQDVVQKLNEAIELRGNHVRVEAIVNDTVGCLCTGAYEDEHAMIGVIYGTGTNACYIENLENISTLNLDPKDSDQMVINTEFGAFGNNGSLNDYRTLYDLRVDVDSMNPGKQIYEKMISGMYIGEICRIACLDFAKQNVFFNGEVGETFKQKYIFETKYVSAIVHDNTPNLERIHYHLHYDLDIPHVSRQDCVAVQQLCKAVTKRAGKFAAIGLAAIIKKINKDKLTIICDGSLYLNFQKFRDYVTEYLSILSPAAEVKFITAKDASGRGAALVAATSCRLKSQSSSPILGRKNSEQSAGESNKSDHSPPHHHNHHGHHHQKKHSGPPPAVAVEGNAAGSVGSEINGTTPSVEVSPAK
ncbi:hexokinase-4-like isoform X2 [Convolutriloba macropyga]|uniref:hexokinase-4-like isoform X2 n=1 Tax=Convolutriloba macropyga TaxID=536237 RepID=UPI003F5208CF